MLDDVKEWMLRAKSNLEHARRVNKNDLAVYGGYIFFEELCFDLQQCVEKSFKALLIYHNIEFPKTHSISKLIELLRENNIDFPDELLPSIDLTLYAVETRYPAYQDAITEQEYKEAVKIANDVYNWAEEQIL